MRPGPLPKFDGALPGSNNTIQPPPGPPPSALQPQASGSAPIRVPPLTPEKAGQYAALFEKSGAQNGTLPGEQAKSIFERAGLPNEILGRIWMLSDTEQRGSLQATEFVIAMHLLASFKSGAMRALPNQLPAGLYEAAARRPPSRQTSLSNSVSAIPRQFSGSAPRVGSPLGRSSFPPQQFPQSTGNDGWAITPNDKTKFDSIYSNLDRAGKGYITGEEAVPFFSESKLPEEALAQIWDLADINSAGVLTRDEFAVAMYLIRQQRGKRDGRDSLPDTLPANLIPPSMRNVRPSANNNAPAFDNIAPTLPKSAAEDLFGLDALSTSPPPPAQIPQSTGGSSSFQQVNDPFAPRSPPAPSSPVRTGPQPSGIFKSFVPSSSFGQQLTGGSGQGASRSMPAQPPVNDDLLGGDDDAEFNSKINNEAAELGNLSNQVGSLSKQMQDVQVQRGTTQNELNQASAQKQQFEQRLAQLRGLYEKEVQDVKSLEERLTASRNETKKLQTEFAMLEGAHQDLQNQHQQIGMALQADQQENNSLKEKMRVINSEIQQLKPALEKLRSDARQQKGLVAINKKQLATNESEREKLKSEADELNKSIEEDKHLLAQAASSTKSQSPPPVVSPAASTISVNNPFFRRQDSARDFTASPFASPTASTPNDRSFENVFGPSFATSSAADTPPMPQTSFKQNLERSDLDNAFTPKSASPELSSREAPFPSSSAFQVPPPPPESRQISSSFLPFPDHVESVSSSRQVSAPNSRFGDDNSTPGASTPTGLAGATPGSSTTVEPTRAKSPVDEQKQDFVPPTMAHTDSIPGAFPGDENSAIVATPTGDSTLSDRAASDPFGKALERNGTAKSDFDSAFAGFGSSAKPQERSHTGSSSADGSSAPAPSAAKQEFPPIAEIYDDDSDSASEAGGFDDNFAPTSAAHSRQASSSQGPPVSQGVPDPAADALSARPAIKQSLTGGSLATTGPPTPNEQASPPTYDNIVSPQDKAQHEVETYNGLLPKREDPTSSTTGSPEQFSKSMAPPTLQDKQPVPPAKVPFDDDFDEFDDLEDAKEGGDDDDFANISAHDRSGLDDFNSIFDNAPAVQNSQTASQPNNAFGTSSQSGTFGAARTSEPAPAQNDTKAVNDNQDWDAIFAGLDEPAHAANTTPPATTAESNTNGVVAAPPTTTKTRPEIGRALTEAGEHDDPILKNLTEMGYARTDALKALEKYDYNMERVS